MRKFLTRCNDRGEGCDGSFVVTVDLNLNIVSPHPAQAKISLGKSSQTLSSKFRIISRFVSLNRVFISCLKQSTAFRSTGAEYEGDEKKRFSTFIITDEALVGAELM
jgi:hypothetical protein